MDANISDLDGDLIQDLFDALSPDDIAVEATAVVATSRDAGTIEAIAIKPATYIKAANIETCVRKASAVSGIVVLASLV